MKYQEYIEERKEVYNTLLQFINDETNENSKYQDLIENFEKLEMDENKADITLFLRLLVQISNHHHRLPNFFKKIEKIFQFFFDFIQTKYGNVEIYKIVKSNKKIVLYFIEQNIITVDKEITEEIKYRSQKTNTKYHYFFYPEIKNFLEKEELKKIEKELNNDVLLNFDNNRHIGENESFLCQLIRNDSIEEFVSFVNRTNFSLFNTVIQPSIFETNSYLIKKHPSLIEYAAFYGSIQIFQYLKYNQVKLNPELWIYAIHSQNAELIHILEENSVYRPSGFYMNCFIKSIKCHHNSMANYFNEMYSTQNNNNNFILINYKSIFQFYNFEYIPIDSRNNNIFYFICRYDYSDLINLYIKPEQENLQSKHLKKAIIDNDTEIIYLLLLKSRKNDISNEFQKNSSLKQIAIPRNITKINDYAFNKCTSLLQISIPTSVTSIGDFAFNECSHLSKITIPSSVSKIGKNAFNQCFLLKKITIPLSVTQIEDCCFQRCISLKQVTIPSTVESIGNSSFRECLSLTQINIPSSVKSIGDNAFCDCRSLRQITIPSSVKTIGDNAFKNCHLLKDLNDAEGNKRRGNNIGFTLLLFFYFLAVFINQFILFIITVVWWSRIHPWFLHGYKSGKTVYISLEITWISSLIIFALLLSLFYFHCYFIKSKRAILTLKRKLIKKIGTYFTAINLSTIACLFITSTISAIISSTYAIKKEEIDGKNIKCLNYIFNGYKGANDWVSNQSLKYQNDLQKWHSKMLEKVYKNDGKISNFYCDEVGVPTLIFAILPFAIFMFIFLCIMITCVKGYFKYKRI